MVGTAETSNGGTISGFTLTLKPGWNLVSVPLAQIQYDGGSCTFGAGELPVWHFNGATFDNVGKFGDHSVRMEPGKGYWVHSANGRACTIRFTPHAEFASYVGFPLRGGGQVSKTRRGWNMIGGLSFPVSLDEVKNDCTVASGPLESLETNRAYARAGLLVPGKGYWVFVETDCTLNGPDSALNPPVISTG